eukprot:CAMPEP_0175060762 /NCGR_PEP_ID=MMETSP0052_2-20121109/13211_1 /TAXON_ID=51329 ORGANISM="Polytomella parva, Strain SAG 63-3" /NCGR_SAMPLE_ID=MMETSP0052_2 /ASSEMBLY_ACC=CAM_ASM_000194 /LENGTH=66 /DNA_ID=CAMNT_0016326545 /DNA_START=357 /DNA_END=557 /DNA_ORIENTATION=+
MTSVSKRNSDTEEAVASVDSSIVALRTFNNHCKCLLNDDDEEEADDDDDDDDDDDSNNENGVSSES